MIATITIISFISPVTTVITLPSFGPGASLGRPGANQPGRAGTGRERTGNAWDPLGLKGEWKRKWKLIYYSRVYIGVILLYRDSGKEKETTIMGLYRVEGERCYRDNGLGSCLVLK